MRKNALVVFDLDGTILKLPVDTKALRSEIIQIFLKEGIQQESWTPLYPAIERGLQKAPHLREKVWKKIDQIEIESAKRVSKNEKTVQMFEKIKEMPKIVYSNNCKEAVQTSLQALGIDLDLFAEFVTRDVPTSIKPSGVPIVRAVENLGTQIDEVFVVGDHEHDMESASQAEAIFLQQNKKIKVIPIGIYKNPERAKKLDAKRAWFLATSVEQVEPFLTSTPIQDSVSVVLLSYNEEGSVLRSIEDAEHFFSLYAPKYEIVVVDDGSRDNTARLLKLNQNPQLKIVTHSQNMGMGKSMRDGYEAATTDYMLHLPADRQVRVQELISFLSHRAPNRVVISTFLNPPSGLQRIGISWIFRGLVRCIGGLKVNFAGSYLFHQTIFKKVDSKNLYSDTFVYSFEILDRFRQVGATFEMIKIQTFMRQTGQSAEFLFSRIWKVFRELIHVRFKRKQHG